MYVEIVNIWASSWDYGTYYIGDQRRLRRACASAQSRQSLRCSHTWSMEVDKGSNQKSDIKPHWKAAHGLWRMSLRIISWDGSFKINSWHDWVSLALLPTFRRTQCKVNLTQSLTEFTETCSIELKNKQKMSCDMKNQQSECGPAKIQISLGIRPVWSESSLSTWRKLGSLDTHWVHSEDSDQTEQMPRLIWVFAGRTLLLLVLSCRGSNVFNNTSKIITFSPVIFRLFLVALWFSCHWEMLGFQRFSISKTTLEHSETLWEFPAISVWLFIWHFFYDNVFSTPFQNTTLVNY